MGGIYISFFVVWYATNKKIAPSAMDMISINFHVFYILRGCCLYSFVDLP